MRLDDFIARRRPAWLELEAAVVMARRGRLSSLSTAEMERFGIIYRHTASDLAIARRDHPESPVVEYLNSLCARAHPLLYGGDPAARASPIDLYRRGIPRAFRAARPYVLASLALLLLGVVAGWLAVELRPDLRASLIPSSLFDQMARGDVRHGLPEAGSVSPVIILNNIRVALMLFAGGVLLGVPTALVLVANGWILGTLAAAVHDGGYNSEFWSLIAPHGVIELSIIVIAGATGLLVGDSILRPGLRSRGDSLITAAGRAVWLVVGAATLLVVAGILEGYVSPSGLPAALKFAVGAGSGGLLYAWLLMSGRDGAAPVAPGGAVAG